MQVYVLHLCVQGTDTSTNRILFMFLLDVEKIFPRTFKFQDISVNGF
jgi:hypothetical protein